MSLSRSLLGGLCLCALLAAGCRSPRLLGPTAVPAPVRPPAGTAAPAASAGVPPAGPPATAPLPGPAAGAPGPRRATPGPTAPPTNPPAAAPGRGARGGSVRLSAQDLAPVDAWVDARNAQWIVGDEVLVEASREYFGPIIAIASRVGSVERTDEVLPEVTTVTLRFMMNRSSLAVENNPRLQVGTGVTVSARRVLRLRLLKAQDVQAPVSLRIVAQGEASHGRGSTVERRAPSLRLGGVLRRASAGWAWVELR